MRVAAAWLAMALSVAGSAGAVAADAVLAQAQLNLHLLGYDPGPYDGSWGGKTKTALTAFYADRGGTFDGSFDANEVDDLYAALGEIPYNGADPDTIFGQHDNWGTGTPAFDFVPATNLVAALPEVTAIVPFDQVSARIRAGSAQDREKSCGWYEAGVPLPETAGTLHTYSSMREFETTANRVPHPGNIWFDDMKWIVSVVAAHTAGVRDPAALDKLHDALLRYARAGAGLDSVHLLDRKTGEIIVTPDFATSTMASTSLTLSYLLVKPRLRYAPEDTAIVERWLNRLFESFGDSFFALKSGSAHDPRSVDLVARATMANGLLNADADTFNRGAKLAAAFISLVREDGSHRFGASRGFRALYYQGVSFSEAMESLVLMESQGLPARELLLPNIERMAGFIEKAFADNSVLWPYAKENNGVTVGSNYKKQDKFEAPTALDMFFAVRPDHPAVPGLREIRKLYEYDSQLTELFNGSCIGVGLAAPLDAYEKSLEASGESAITDGRLIITKTGEDKGFVGFRLTLSGRFKERSITRSFDMLSDFDKGPNTPENLVLLRIAVPKAGMDSMQSQGADYAVCDPVAVRPDGMPNLHFGYEDIYNSCVYAHMAPEDAELWTAIVTTLPALVHVAAATGPDAAGQLERLFAVKALPVDGL